MGDNFISELPVTSENNANISHIFRRVLQCVPRLRFSEQVTKQSSFSFSDGRLKWER